MAMSYTPPQRPGPTCLEAGDQVKLTLELSAHGETAGRYRLAAGKCTIGSSPSCQIQLDSPGVRPLHCLLIIDEAGVKATRWAPGILHNGEDFTNADLADGDCLSIDELCLKVVSDSQDEVPFPTSDPDDRELTDLRPDDVVPSSASDGLDCESLENGSDRQPESALELVDQIEDSLNGLEFSSDSRIHYDRAEIARQRCRRLIGNLRKLRETQSSLQAELAELSTRFEATCEERKRLQEDISDLRKKALQQESEHSIEVERLIGELSAAYEKSNGVEQSLHEAEVQRDAAREQSEQLERNLAIAQADLGEARDQQQRLEQAFQQYEQQCAELQQKLEVAEQSMHYSAQQEADQSTKVAGLEQELADAKQELATLREEHTATLQLQAENEAKYEDLQQKLSCAESTTQSALADLANRTTTFEDLQRKQAELGTERDQLASKNHQLSDELESAQYQLTEALQERSQLSARVQQLTDDAENLREELTTARQEQGELQTDNERLVADLKAARCSVSQFDIERDKAAIDKAQMESEIESLRRELTDSQNVHDELVTRCERSSRELEAKQLELTTMQQKLLDSAESQSSLQEALEQEKAQYASLEQVVSTLRDERNENIQSRESFAKERAELEKRITLLEIDIKSADSEHQRSLATVSQLQEQLAAAENQAAEASRLHASQLQEHESSDTHVHDLTSQLESAREEIDSLREQVESAARDIESYRKCEQQFDEDRSRLASGIKSREERISELQTELEQTQLQLSACASQAEQLNTAYEQALLALDEARTDQSGEAVPEVMGRTPEVASAPETPQVEVQAQEPEPLSASPAEMVSDLDENSAQDQTSPDWVEEQPAHKIESEEVAEPSVLADITRESALLDADEEQDSPAPVPPTPESQQQEYQPTSFIDQYSHLFDDSDGYEPTPETPSEKPWGVDAIDSQQDLDGDAALDEYMSNLMRRVRGESSSDSIGPPLTVPVPDTSEALENDPVERMNELTSRVAAPSYVEEPTDDEPFDLERLKQSSKKPPLQANLQAMRELANTSARTAIASHRKRRFIEGAVSKIMVSVVAGGAAAFMTLTADSYTSPLFLGGCAVGVVSTYWGLKLFGVLLERIRDGAEQKIAGPAELDPSGEPLPIDGTDDFRMNAN